MSAVTNNDNKTQDLLASLMGPPDASNADSDNNKNSSSSSDSNELLFDDVALTTTGEDENNNNNRNDLVVAEATPDQMATDDANNNNMNRNRNHQTSLVNETSKENNHPIGRTTEDENLFGSATMSQTSTANNNNNNNSTTETTRSSALEASGLLTLLAKGGDDLNASSNQQQQGGGGGLFDEIDQQEQQKQQQLQQQQRLLQEQQQEAEKRRRQQEEQAAAVQREQQQEQGMMNQKIEGMTLPTAPGQHSSVAPQQQQDGYLHQQQQQQQYSSHHHYQQQQPYSPPLPNAQQQPVPAAPVQAGFYRDYPAPATPQEGSASSDGSANGPTTTLPSNVYGGARIYANVQPPTPQAKSSPALPFHSPSPQQQQQHQEPYYPNALSSPPAKGSGPYTNNLHSGLPPPGSQQPPYSPAPHAPPGSAPPPHGAPPVSMMRIVQPPPPPTIYGKVTVSDPLLIQASGGLLGLRQAPHWSYQIVTTVLPLSNANTHAMPAPATTQTMVRRRFRHVVALEDRLRQDCPGAILPPRPDKHVARALEEATTHQSAEFAKQRTVEIEYYLNQLAQHPIAASSPILRFFLALQDDLGTAWPECSLNALTRLANVGVGAAVQLSESTAATKFPWDTSNSAVGSGMGPAGMMDPNHYDYYEDNAELLALQSSESARMGAVLQGVPKLEGAITLLKEHAELKGAAGMEIGKLAKECNADDRDVAQPLEMLSHGMLRDGRRSRRMSAELGTALYCFSHHYKVCRYERMAFADRRSALVRRSKERGKADQRAAQLYLQQRAAQQQQQQQYYAGHHIHQPPPPPPQQYPYGGHPGGLDRLEREAVVLDEWAVDAVRECNEIGARLKSEINRVAWQRRTEWHAAVKVMASSMKEACSERLAIWEQARESFLQAFPGEREA